MRIEGGQQLAKALREMSTRLARQEMQGILRKAAQPFASSIAQAAPKGDPAPPNISDVAVSKKTAKGLMARVAVGPPKGAFYGYFQEWGFKSVPGKGFMRSAFDTAQSSALEIIRREVWAAVKGGRGSGGSGLL